MLSASSQPLAVSHPVPECFARLVAARCGIREWTAGGREGGMGGGGGAVRVSLMSDLFFFLNFSRALACV